VCSSELNELSIWGRDRGQGRRGNWRVEEVEIGQGRRGREGGRCCVIPVVRVVHVVSLCCSFRFVRVVLFREEKEEGEGEVEEEREMEGDKEREREREGEEEYSGG
jgi:hypothetical protein